MNNDSENPKESEDKMNYNSEDLKDSYELTMKHYELICKEFTDYFKMYMQSWSIVGSAIIVGAIFGPEGKLNGKNVYNYIVCAIPLLILIWLLTTSWFWGYFKIYRTYLSLLEERMLKLLNVIEPPENVVLFHSFRKQWFEGNDIKSGTILTGAIVSIVYFLIAFSALMNICNDYSSPIFIFFSIIYTLALMFSMISAYRILNSTPDTSTIEKIKKKIYGVK